MQLPSKRAVIASSAAVAVLDAPLAMAAGEGFPVRIGKRNPARGAATQETKIDVTLPELVAVGFRNHDLDVALLEARELHGDQTEAGL